MSQERQRGDGPNLPRKKRVLPEDFRQRIRYRTYEVTGRGVLTFVHDNILDLSACRNILDHLIPEPEPEIRDEAPTPRQAKALMMEMQKIANKSYGYRVLAARCRSDDRIRRFAQHPKAPAHAKAFPRIVLPSLANLEKRRHVAREAALHLVREVWGTLDHRDPPRVLWCRSAHPKVQGGLVRLTYADLGTFNGWQFTIAKAPSVDTPEEEMVFLLEDMRPWVTSSRYPMENQRAPRVRKKRFPLLEDLVLRHIEAVQATYVLNPEVQAFQRWLFCPGSRRV